MRGRVRVELDGGTHWASEVQCNAFGPWSNFYVRSASALVTYPALSSFCWSDSTANVNWLRLLLYHFLIRHLGLPNTAMLSLKR